MVLLCCLPARLSSQEVLTGLPNNPMVQERFRQYLQLQESLLADDTPVSLPFYDDFSADNVFPDQSKWIDRYAFENNDIPIYPINMGAMTLDAVNDSGNMYPDAVPGPQGFIADHLTSRFIRLDSVFAPVPRALTPADSVYLSFYYQPQGRARAPQAADSLILEFLVTPAHDSILPDDTIAVPDLWRKVWFSTGLTLDTFYMRNNVWFKRVMIPITDTVFFTGKFRFRFFNYASLASVAEPSWQSNCDQWNIDEIYLNSGRSMADTIRPELRFIYKPPSLLSRYESMPYPQYCDDPTNEIRDTLDILMTNRDIVPHMSVYGYTVTQEGGTFSKGYSGGNYNIQPYTVVPYVTYQKFAHPELPFLLPISQADSAEFLVRHIVRDNTPGSVIGDTMEAYQKFHNYFAYDDGTPEASYGLSPAGSMLAYRFKLNKSPDTLRAINIYFTRTLGNNNVQNFFLCVWNDNAGKPGDTIYSALATPKYADQLNKFVTYHIDPPLRITGTFYVGTVQTTDDNLSIGFDRYNNSQDEVFINYSGTWYNSAFIGSPMIRPVIGKPIPLAAGEIAAPNRKLLVWPNPCHTGKISLSLLGNEPTGNGNKKGTVSISDLLGHVRLSADLQATIDVSHLPAGFYILSVTDEDGKPAGSSRLIIAR